MGIKCWVETEGVRCVVNLDAGGLKMDLFFVVIRCSKYIFDTI